ncbi:TolC family protein [Edaphobacter flagellatus]|uniref:TolC family protein n=1 Tax=Edaphobacter flagellatus TaxID=1933044 RepID=UPI0021B2B7E6|nr:TolC family protein [Edaphobacter flagellatus]
MLLIKKGCRWPKVRFPAVLVLSSLALLARGQEATTSPIISLSDAIHRAQQNEPVFARAIAAQQNAGINSYLAKAALLPSVVYHNQMLYTQPNGQTNQGTMTLPAFIANNAVHEYVSQASINETIGVKQLADARVASANAAVASADLEVARRGLVAAVVNLYYQVSTSETKRQLLREAYDEATTFADLTQKREASREIAHADVVKAQLQQQQRQRDLSDAVLAADKARLELGVLLFPDPRTAYTTQAPGAPPAMPTRDEVNQSAFANNPDLRSALASVQAGDAGVTSAKAGYLPDLALNFSYGIDAAQFAKYGPDGVRNLGYSISGTLDIPVWDWLSTQKRIKQSEIQRDAAKTMLTATQRRLIATLEEAYAEANTARDQLNLLDQSVHSSIESLRLTKLRYSAGESTALEVVDAQNTLLAAQIAQADGAVRYQSALAALQILTGTL